MHNRIKIFRESTEIFNVYASEGKYRGINAKGTIDEIFEKTEDLLYKEGIILEDDNQQSV